MFTKFHAHHHSKRQLVNEVDVSTSPKPRHSHRYTRASPPPIPLTRKQYPTARVVVCGQLCERQVRTDRP